MIFAGISCLLSYRAADSVGMKRSQSVCVSSTEMGTTDVVEWPVYEQIFWILLGCFFEQVELFPVKISQYASIL